MEFNEDTPGIITSMVRYHLYYQISKFLKDLSKLDRYISHVPNTIKNINPPPTCGPTHLTKAARKLIRGLVSKKIKAKLEIIVTLKTQKDTSPASHMKKSLVISQ